LLLLCLSPLHEQTIAFAEERDDALRAHAELAAERDEIAAECRRADDRASAVSRQLAEMLFREEQRLSGDPGLGRARGVEVF